MSVEAASTMAQILPVFLLAIVIDNALPTNVPRNAQKIVFRISYWSAVAIAFSESLLILAVIQREPLNEFGATIVTAVTFVSLALLIFGHAAKAEARHTNQDPES